MNRTKYIQIRRIKSVVYYTIRGIVLLPIRLLLLPFKLLRRAVFFRRPKYNKFKRPNDTIITVIFNKLRKNSADIKALEDRNEVLSSRINKQLELINDNNSDIKFEIKALKDELNSMINWRNNYAVKYIQSGKHRLKTLEDKVAGCYTVSNDNQECIATFSDKVRTLEDSIEGVSKDCRAVEMKVNNIKYDIKCKESGIIKDLVFNMPDEPTQIELAEIEAEQYGEKVIREEYDWTHEQKTQNELIQAKMRADEAEYDRLSEPDEDDNLLW